MGKGERQDFCQICKRQVARNRLTWRRFQCQQSEQQNYLAASEYNATDWEASVAVENTAWGLFPDDRMPSFDSSYTVTWTNGLATYDGSATVRTLAGVDVSAWTSLVFSVYVGAHQESLTPELAITIGLASEDGLTTQVLKTKTTKFAGRIWATVTPAEITSISISAVCVYITVVGTGKWWFERAQLEKDVVTPGRPIKTSGTAVAETAQRTVIDMVKACPRCREDMPNDPRDVAEDVDPDRSYEWFTDENEVEA